VIGRRHDSTGARIVIGIGRLELGERSGVVQVDDRVLRRGRRAQCAVAQQSHSESEIGVSHDERSVQALTIP